MARKSGDNSNPKNGLNDVIGVALILFIAIPLLCAQLSFDRNDISFITTHLNKPPHNWIGLLGAWVAYGSFCLLGGAAYLLPLLVGVFGVSYLLNIFGYLRERLVWSLVWMVVLLVAVSGVLFMADNGGQDGRFHLAKGVQSAGGMLGYLTFGQTQNWDFGFSLLGNLGATIVYVALGLISLLFLTNFHLGHWIRVLLQKRGAAPEDQFKSEDEIALEKRARELEKQKRKLEDEVVKTEKIAEKTASGLGADGLPVPEPTVRDLSVPQAKGPRFRKTTLPEPPKEIEPADDPLEVGEVIHAEEIPPATTEQILGKKSPTPEPVAKEKVDVPEPAEPKP